MLKQQRTLLMETNRMKTIGVLPERILRWLS